MASNDVLDLESIGRAAPADPVIDREQKKLELQQQKNLIGLQNALPDLVMRIDPLGVFARGTRAAGNIGAGAVEDIGLEAGRLFGLTPEPSRFENLRHAMTEWTPTPVEEGLAQERGVSAALTRGGIGAVKTAPTLAAGAAITAATKLPPAVVYPTLFGGETYVHTSPEELERAGQPPMTPLKRAIEVTKAALIGAVYPLVGTWVKPVSATFINRMGLYNSPNAQKAVELAVDQAIMQAVTEVITVTEYMSDPERPNKSPEELAELMVESFGNIALFAVPRALGYFRGMPSEYEAGMRRAIAEEKVRLRNVFRQQDWKRMQLAINRAETAGARPEDLQAEAMRAGLIQPRPDREMTVEERQAQATAASDWARADLESEFMEATGGDPSRFQQRITRSVKPVVIRPAFGGTSPARRLAARFAEEEVGTPITIGTTGGPSAVHETPEGTVRTVQQPGGPTTSPGKVPPTVGGAQTGARSGGAAGKAPGAKEETTAAETGELNIVYPKAPGVPPAKEGDIVELYGHVGELGKDENGRDVIRTDNGVVEIPQGATVTVRLTVTPDGRIVQNGVLFEPSVGAGKPWTNAYDREKGWLRIRKVGDGVRLVLSGPTADWVVARLTRIAPPKPPSRSLRVPKLPEKVTETGLAEGETMQADTPVDEYILGTGVAKEAEQRRAREAKDAAELAEMERQDAAERVAATVTLKNNVPIKLPELQLERYRRKGGDPHTGEIQPASIAYQPTGANAGHIVVLGRKGYYSYRVPLVALPEGSWKHVKGGIEFDKRALMAFLNDDVRRFSNRNQSNRGEYFLPKDIDAITGVTTMGRPGLPGRRVNLDLPTGEGGGTLQNVLNVPHPSAEEIGRPFTGIVRRAIDELRNKNTDLFIQLRDRKASELDETFWNSVRTALMQMDEFKSLPEAIDVLHSADAMVRLLQEAKESGRFREQAIIQGPIEDPHNPDNWKIRYDPVLTKDHPQHKWVLHWEGEPAPWQKRFKINGYVNAIEGFFRSAAEANEARMFASRMFRTLNTLRDQDNISGHPGNPANWAIEFTGNREPWASRKVPWHIVTTDPYFTAGAGSGKPEKVSPLKYIWSSFETEAEAIRHWKEDIRNFNAWRARARGSLGEAEAREVRVRGIPEEKLVASADVLWNIIKSIEDGTFKRGKKLSDSQRDNLLQSYRRKLDAINRELERRKRGPQAAIGGESIVPPSKASAMGQPMDPATKALIDAAKLPDTVAANLAEARALVDNPANGLDPETRAVLRDILNSPLAGYFVGERDLSLRITDYIDHRVSARYEPWERLIRLSRYVDDPLHAAHEFFHPLFELLQKEDIARVEHWRQDAIDKMLQTVRGKDNLDLRSLRSGINYREFLELGINEKLYPLSSTEEFFAWMMTNRFQKDRLGIWGQAKEIYRSQDTFIAKIKQIIAVIMDAIQQRLIRFGFKASQFDTLRRTLLDGTYDVISPGESIPGKRLVTKNGIITAPGANRPDAAITAYHGTPHRVTPAFSTARIDTGQGAQTYGWGLYMAERPEVAGEYQRALTRSITTTADIIARDALAKSKADPKQAEMTIRGWAGLYQERDIAEAIQKLRTGDIQGAGNIYTVRLDVDPTDLLDWDKPLSQQSQTVKSKLAKVVELTDFMVADVTGDTSHPQPTGRDIYRTLEEKFSKVHTFSSGATEWMANVPNDQKASVYLNYIGIPGIKYLDQGSRPTKFAGLELDRPVTPEQMAMIEEAAHKAGWDADAPFTEKDLASVLYNASVTPGHLEVAEFARKLIPGIRSDAVRVPDLPPVIAHTAPTYEAAKAWADQNGLTEIGRGREGSWVVWKPGEQTYNFVIFDESKIHITHENGQEVPLRQAMGEPRAPQAALQSEKAIEAFVEPLEETETPERFRRIASTINTGLISRAAGDRFFNLPVGVNLELKDLFTGRIGTQQPDAQSFRDAMKDPSLTPEEKSDLSRYGLMELVGFQRDRKRIINRWENAARKLDQFTRQAIESIPPTNEAELRASISLGTVLDKIKAEREEIAQGAQSNERIREGIDHLDALNQLLGQPLAMSRALRGISDIVGRAELLNERRGEEVLNLISERAGYPTADSPTPHTPTQWVRGLAHHLDQMRDGDRRRVNASEDVIEATLWMLRQRADWKQELLEAQMTEDGTLRRFNAEYMNDLRAKVPTGFNGVLSKYARHEAEARALRSAANRLNRKIISLEERKNNLDQAVAFIRQHDVDPDFVDFGKAVVETTGAISGLVQTDNGYTVTLKNPITGLDVTLDFGFNKAESKQNIDRIIQLDEAGMQYAARPDADPTIAAFWKDFNQRVRHELPVMDPAYERLVDPLFDPLNILTLGVSRLVTHSRYGLIVGSTMARLPGPLPHMTERAMEAFGIALKTKNAFDKDQGQRVHNANEAALRSHKKIPGNRVTDEATWRDEVAGPIIDKRQHFGQRPYRVGDHIAGFGHIITPEDMKAVQAQYKYDQFLIRLAFKSGYISAIAEAPGRVKDPRLKLLRFPLSQGPGTVTRYLPMESRRLPDEWAAAVERFKVDEFLESADNFVRTVLGHVLEDERLYFDKYPDFAKGIYSEDYKHIRSMREELESSGEMPNNMNDLAQMIATRHNTHLKDGEEPSTPADVRQQLIDEVTVYMKEIAKDEAERKQTESRIDIVSHENEYSQPRTAKIAPGTLYRYGVTDKIDMIRKGNNAVEFYVVRYRDLLRKTHDALLDEKRKVVDTLESEYGGKGWKARQEFRKGIIAGDDARLQKHQMTVRELDSNIDRTGKLLQNANDIIRRREEYYGDDIADRLFSPWMNSAVGSVLLSPRAWLTNLGSGDVMWALKAAEIRRGGWMNMPIVYVKDHLAGYMKAIVRARVPKNAKERAYKKLIEDNPALIEGIADHLAGILQHIQDREALKRTGVIDSHSYKDAFGWDTDRPTAENLRGIVDALMDIKAEPSLSARKDIFNAIGMIPRGFNQVLARKIGMRNVDNMINARSVVFASALADTLRTQAIKSFDGRLEHDPVFRQAFEQYGDNFDRFYLQLMRNAKKGVLLTPAELTGRWTPVSALTISKAAVQLRRQFSRNNDPVDWLMLKYWWNKRANNGDRNAPFMDPQQRLALHFSLAEDVNMASPATRPTYFMGTKNRQMAGVLSQWWLWDVNRLQDIFSKVRGQKTGGVRYLPGAIAFLFATAAAGLVYTSTGQKLNELAFNAVGNQPNIWDAETDEDKLRIITSLAANYWGMVGSFYKAVTDTPGKLGYRNPIFYLNMANDILSAGMKIWSSGDFKGPLLDLTARYVPPLRAIINRLPSRQGLMEIRDAANLLRAATPESLEAKRRAPVSGTDIRATPMTPLYNAILNAAAVGDWSAADESFAKAVELARASGIANPEQSIVSAIRSRSPETAVFSRALSDEERDLVYSRLNPANLERVEKANRVFEEIASRYGGGGGGGGRAAGGVGGRSIAAGIAPRIALGAFGAGARVGIAAGRAVSLAPRAVRTGFRTRSLQRGLRVRSLLRGPRRPSVGGRLRRLAI